MGKLDEFFAGNLIPHIIEGFPYKEKMCRHCERPMELMQSIHMLDKEHYKALFICKSPDCPALKIEPYKAHAVVYYSDPEAFANLELHRIWYSRDRNKIR